MRTVSDLIGDQEGSKRMVILLISMLKLNHRAEKIIKKGKASYPGTVIEDFVEE